MKMKKDYTEEEFEVLTDLQVAEFDYINNSKKFGALGKACAYKCVLEARIEAAKLGLVEYDILTLETELRDTEEVIKELKKAKEKDIDIDITKELPF